MLLSLLYQLKQEHEADYLSLRHDLETAASVADNDLQQNRQQLSQLAATLFAKNQQ
jgi:ABC-type oligopeptide transport system ATPase subunit